MPYLIGFVLGLVVVFAVFLMLALLVTIINGWAVLILGFILGTLVIRALSPRRASV